jgi:hypothetical protein
LSLSLRRPLNCDLTDDIATVQLAAGADRRALRVLAGCSRPSRLGRRVPGALYEKAGLLFRPLRFWKTSGHVTLTSGLLQIGGLLITDTYSRREVSAIEIRRRAIAPFAANLVIRTHDGRVKKLWWSDIDGLAEALAADSWPLT